MKPEEIEELKGIASSVEDEVELEKHGRFKGAPWYSKDDTNVLIGGAGGIGSWLTVLISRAGFKPVVYDFDQLEIHNLSGQLFFKNDVGLLKTEALFHIVKELNDEDIQVINEKYDATSMTHEYVFSAFDNMSARSIMFEKWAEANIGNKNAIFIDGRLIMEQLTIFCVRGDDYENINEYRSTHIFPDSDVEEGLCTMKQTSHSAALIGALMTGFFTNHYTNVTRDKIVRNVPFMTTYYIPLNMFGNE